MKPRYHRLDRARCWSFVLLSLSVLGVSIGFANPVEAFVRTMTCTVTGQAACRPGEVAVPIFWPSGCVPFYINERGLDGALSPEVRTAIQDSFQTWAEPSCGYLSFVYMGTTPIQEVGYDQNLGVDGNTNVVVFREQDWSNLSGVVALTSVSYAPSTGEIVDADIEFNAVDFSLGTTGRTNQSDIANTLTHEVGHFLGLDHSPVSSATMLATAPLGETSKRSLEQDDIDGLCTIYAQNNACGVESFQGRCPASSVVMPECQQNGEEDGGCAGCASATGGRSGNTVLALLFLALIGMVRRRSREKHR